MKRYNNRKYRLKYRITFNFGLKGKETHTYGKKSSVWGFISRFQPKNSDCGGDVYVEYKNDIYNSAEFKTKQEAIDLLSYFTEKDVLDWAEGFK